MFSAPSHILDDIPGTLMLTDCLEQCQANDTCRAVNYETGLCVLFSNDADQLPGDSHTPTLNNMISASRFDPRPKNNVARP